MRKTGMTHSRQPRTASNSPIAPEQTGDYLSSSWGGHHAFDLNLYQVLGHPSDFSDTDGGDRTERILVFDSAGCRNQTLLIQQRSEILLHPTPLRDQDPPPDELYDHHD